jgi:hypothetical protein
MKSIQSWFFAGSLVWVGACNDDGEAGPVAVDSGVSNVAVGDAGGSTEVGKVVDAGATGMDAGLQTDAAASGLDAGGSVDAGSVLVTDAGSSDGGSTDAGSSDAGNVDAGTIEVAGHWHSNFDTNEEIDNTKWTYTTLIAFDNDLNVAITQNSATDMFGPNQFNRYVWTPIDTTDGSFFYCTVDFGLATASEARASTKTADASDPLNSGCGGFGWTKLSPAGADAGM